MPQAAAQDDDSNNSADFTSQDIAQCEQRYRNGRNGKPDSAQLQCTARTALEVGTDGLSHAPECYPRHCLIGFRDWTTGSL